MDKSSNIPLIAYGTWIDHDPSQMYRLVQSAVNLGYTHIDTAKNYDTESYVFEAISNMPRDRIFLTSKVRSIIDIDILRSELGSIQYYDLLLLHYPPIGTHSIERFKSELLPLWIGINSYLSSGITRAIGVSNFYQNHLQALLDLCQEYSLSPPSVNQIEIHPGNLELNYVPWMQNHNIVVFAHTPLGGLGSQYVLNNDILVSISERLNATPAQVIIAYLMKRGIGVVTASKNLVHMKESLESFKYIEYIGMDDVNLINSTDFGLGPMIEGASISYSDNMELY